MEAFLSIPIASEHYLQRITRNGKGFTTSFTDIMSGAEPVFEMGGGKTVFWKQ